MKIFGPILLIPIFLLGSLAQASEVVCARLCATHIVRQELEHKMPRGLLAAIARIESGKKIEFVKGSVAWPWAINVEGQPFYFKTKSEAIQAVQKHVKSGKRNVDIGCMQINYHHHGENFDSITAMFDPKKNVEYGAQFLKNLKKTHGSWSKAVGMYHSATLKYQVPYRAKVYQTWQKERRTPYYEEFLKGARDPQSAYRQALYDAAASGTQPTEPLFFMLEGKNPSTKALYQRVSNHSNYGFTQSKNRTLRKNSKNLSKTKQEKMITIAKGPYFFKPHDGSS